MEKNYFLWGQLENKENIGLKGSEQWLGVGILLFQTNLGVWILGVSMQSCCSSEDYNIECKGLTDNSCSYSLPYSIRVWEREAWERMPNSSLSLIVMYILFFLDRFNYAGIKNNFIK
jgi:hypothetical protein